MHFDDLVVRFAPRWLADAYVDSALWRHLQSGRARSVAKRRPAVEWRVLAFRYDQEPRDTFLVLAPFRDDEFAWDAFDQDGVRRPLPTYSPDAGVELGTVEWIGHHLFIKTVRFGCQRLSTSKLGVGAFAGVAEARVTLVEIRETLSADS